MTTKEYEAVMIYPQTKKRLKVKCAQEGRTFDEEIEFLINFHEANKI